MTDEFCSEADDAISQDTGAEIEEAGTAHHPATRRKRTASPAASSSAAAPKRATAVAGHRDKNARARGWCFTAYDLRKEPYEALEAEALVVGQETCPTTKRIHFQGFVYFKSAKTFSAVQKALPFGTHIEKMRGTPAQAWEYCEKEGNVVVTKGSKPAGQGTRSDIEMLMKQIADGATMEQVADACGEVWFKYHRAAERYMEMKRGKPRKDPSKVIVLWGDAGTGKTRRAVQEGAQPVEFQGKRFVAGYDYQEVVVFDDFEDDQVPRGMFLKLLDRYAYKIDVKGGCKDWAPKVIFITSNHDPATWYGGDDAVRRRLHEVHWYRSMEGGMVQIDDQSAQYAARFAQ